MTLRARVALVRSAYWPAALLAMSAAAIAALAAGRSGTELFALTIGGALAMTAAWRPLAMFALRRIVTQHQARTHAAVDDGDDEARRRLHAEIDEYYRVFAPRAEALRARQRCHALNADEHWQEAIASLASIDREALSPSERVHHDNTLAWSCAHAGETARAVELARANVDAPSDARTRPFLLGTLGCALVLDGQHQAALAPLRDAIALGGPRWAQAVRQYYLGDGLAALGRADEAQAAWRAATAIAPRSRWGRRAQERLDAGTPAAYR